MSDTKIIELAAEHATCAECHGFGEIAGSPCGVCNGTGAEPRAVEAIERLIAERETFFLNIGELVHAERRPGETHIEQTVQRLVEEVRRLRVELSQAEGNLAKFEVHSQSIVLSAARLCRSLWVENLSEVDTALHNLEAVRRENLLLRHIATRVASILGCEIADDANPFTASDIERHLPDLAYRAIRGSR